MICERIQTNLKCTPRIFGRNFADTIYILDEYEYMGDVSLVYFVILFDEHHFTPVGTQCVLLNENTMLVVVWGKIILAHRVEK